MASWKFITNHSGVLSLVSRRGQITARDIAHELGITERSVHRIIADLEAEGYLLRRRQGRLNVYAVNGNLPLGGPGPGETNVRDLLKAIAPKAAAKRPLLARRGAGMARGSRSRR